MEDVLFIRGWGLGGGADVQLKELYLKLPLGWMVNNY